MAFHAVATLGRGLLQLSNEAIYFQPHPNFSNDPVKQVGLTPRNLGGGNSLRILVPPMEG